MKTIGRSRSVPFFSLFLYIGLLLFSFPLEAQKVPFPAFSNEKNAEARAQYLAGNFIQAQKMYERIFAANPRDDEAAYILGCMASLNYNWQVAFDYLAVAVNAKPRTMQYVLYYSQAFEGLIKKASPLSAAAKAREFKVFAEKASETFPDSAEIQQIIIKFHISAPFIVGGSKKEARRRLALMKILSPSFGYRVEALLADAEDDLDTADSLFKQSASYGEARTYLEWALWLVKCGRSEEAVKIIASNLDNTDRPILMRYILGRICAETGVRNVEGIAALDEYLALPWEIDIATKPEAYYQKARNLLALDRKKEARAELNKCLAIRPDLQRAIDMLETVGD